MSFSPAALSHLLVALGLVLAAAHGVGYLFRKLRQPQVIGEIIGGLLLGPTVLGALAPPLQHRLFEGTPSTWFVLGAMYQFGLLLLMFCSGLEMRSTFQTAERKTVAIITVCGVAVPLLLVVALRNYVSLDAHLGAARNETALLVVLAIAVAVTSIPVISRIFFDLGIIETAFARIVLSIAVIEDVLLYVLLAMALSLVAGGQESNFGLPAMLGLEGASPAALGYHVSATVAFFVVAALAAPALGRPRSWRWVREINPVTLQLVLLLGITGVALFLGIAPMLGAFVAGIAAHRATQKAARSRATIKNFSFAFFVPIYFAIVGLRLDLVRYFDPLFFVVFFVFACAVKLACTYLGGRLAGESNWGAWNLAVALNARGGPGIVLASVAFDAKIINEGLYASLVMLAILTSSLAGAWLEAVVRRGWSLR